MGCYAIGLMDRRTVTSHTNPLYSWIGTQQWWKGTGTPSHLFFDNGKCFVPETMTNTFNNMYANMVVKGVDQYIIEQKTRIFRYLIDLDISRELEESVLHAVLVTIYKTAFAFFRVESPVVVCTREPQREPAYKTGIHLFWENVFTDAKDCLALRKQLVHTCRQEFPDLLDWDKTIDSSIYKANGIRMIGSKKKDLSNVYMPKYVLHPSGDIISILEPLTEFKKWVSKTSIRYTGQKSYSLEMDAQTSDVSEDMEETYLARKNPNLKKISLASIAEAIPSILSCWSHYSNSHITGAFYNEDTKHYYLRSDSKYCMNKIGGCHHNNNIYFTVSKDYVRQRCFCRCQTMEGRRHGFCENYFSVPKPLHSSAKYILFGIPVMKLNDYCRPKTPQELLQQLQAAKLGKK